MVYSLISEFNGLVSRIMNLTKANMDALQIEESSYPAQFVEALNVNGGDLQGATVLDYIMHFMTFFWKVCKKIFQSKKQLTNNE